MNPICPMCRRRLTGYQGYHALYLDENIYEDFTDDFGTWSIMEEDWTIHLLRSIYKKCTAAYFVPVKYLLFQMWSYKPKTVMWLHNLLL